jgi:PST family polysaccharide transporter
LNTAVSRLGTLGIGIALARLLGPEAFGTFAVATVALYAILAFNELGVSLAIVRWPGDPHAIAPTVTTISAVSSSVLFVASYFAAPAFSAAMGDPSATPVVRLMCVCILINGLVASPAALMQREFMQRTRMIVDQVNVWVGAFLSIGLAVAGFGAMSLAIGRVAGAALSAALFILWAPGRLRFGLDRSVLPALLRFGFPLAGASIVVFAAGYADQIVAGSVLGPTQLGFYVLAFNLASWPVSVFSQPLRSVAPAAFARLQHDATAMTETFRSVMGVLAALTLPLCLLLAGAATPLIEFVYGEQWMPAADALRWLAVLAAFRIMFELAYDYLVVRRFTGSLLVVQIVWLAGLIPASIIGAKADGIGGLALAQVIVAAVVTAPLYGWFLHRSGLAVHRTVGRLVVPVLAGIIAGAAALAIAASISNPFLACVVASVPALAIVAVALHRDRATLRSLRAMRAPEAVSA